jgi:hypothetical protein
MHFDDTCHREVLLKLADALQFGCNSLNRDLHASIIVQLNVCAILAWWLPGEIPRKTSEDVTTWCIPRGETPRNDVTTEPDRRQMSLSLKCHRSQTTLMLPGAIPNHHVPMQQTASHSWLPYLTEQSRIEIQEAITANCCYSSLPNFFIISLP